MPYRLKVGGKFNFSKLPADLKNKLKAQIKDNEQKSFKIDGKPVTKELIKELEANVINKVKKPVEEVKIKESGLLEEFEAVKEKGFYALRRWAKQKLGVTDRSENALIKEIKKIIKKMEGN